MDRDGAEKVLYFLEEIEKWSGQKILEYHSGGTIYSTAIHLHSEKFEKYMIMGKLKTPAYLIKEEQIIANTIKKRYKFTPSKGWKLTQEEIILNKFLDDYFPRNYLGWSQLQAFIAQSTPKSKKSQTLEGLTVDIFPIKEIKIGGGIKYDSSAKASLIIGNERVEKYLQNENLTIIEKRVEKIPVF